MLGFEIWKGCDADEVWEVRVVVGRVGADVWS